MGYFFNKGERKERPGLYQRYENRGMDPVAGAMVGVCAITIQADWGPLNEVATISRYDDLAKLYGVNGTVADAQELFNGGANTVHVCRIGNGGAKASVDLMDDAGVAVVKVESLYPGVREFAVSIKAVLGDDTKKQFIITEGATELEKIEFAAGENEIANLLAAVEEYRSDYVAVTKVTDSTGTMAAVLQTALTGGKNPEVATADYSTGFNMLETVEWNTISVDTDDNAVHALLVTFMDRVYKTGKFSTCVIGDPISVAFADRLKKSRAYNSELVNYFGSGWVNTLGKKVDGHLAVNHVAGVIASTSSSNSITHTQISGAVDLIERHTYEEYVAAIKAGCLMLSMGPDKQVWFDSGVNTLITPNADQDEGWKKIKRVAVRNELMMRIDKTVAKKVGRVNNDSDGRADVIQAGQAVLNAMVAEGGKIMEGASFYLDPNNPPQGDEAWFIIDADDIDALEKIYLLYRFRYSQLA